jgi:hypothetical protein
MMDQFPVKVVVSSMAVRKLNDEMIKDIEHILMYAGVFIKNPKHRRHSIHMQQLRTHFTIYCNWTHDRFKAAFKHLKTSPAYESIACFAGINPDNPTLALTNFGYQYLGYCNTNKVVYDLYQSCVHKYDEFMAVNGYDLIINDYEKRYEEARKLKAEENKTDNRIGRPSKLWTRKS